jgi:glyoxylase-like metal-dependent hydrolase (beta-lactamase superfamily II)/rhodanese-related sulfurtransferase
MALTVINIDTPTLGDRSYIAHDGESALVVDPQRDIDRVTSILDREGVTLDTVVETHMHNDYVSGGLVLAREFGARYVTSADDPVKFDRTPARDLEEFQVGSFGIKAVKSPGHTFNHLAYILMDGTSKPEGIFTGGSMLHGSTGRPDLLGPDSAPILAKCQHETVNRLVSLLDDSTPIYPTHGFGSFCAATSTSGESSTIADEKRKNPALMMNLDRFVSVTLAGLDAFPAYYKYMGPANLSGPGAVDLSALQRLSRDQVVRALASGTYVVDLRNRDDWAAAHLPGTLNFGINGSFATYFGWIFPYEKDVILLSDRKEDIALAQRELVRIGIDEPAGAYISGEFDRASSVRTVTFKDIHQVLKDQQVVVLDVRRNSERLASHIAGTIHIPFHELQSRVSELPKDKEIFVHCAGAYRAAAAAGLLELAGLTPVIINESYERALDVVGLEIVERDLDRGSAGLANHEARV